MGCSGHFRFTTNWSTQITSGSSSFCLPEAVGAFKDKYAGVLTTSIHFFDHTAIDYMNGICDDLGMKFVGSYSAAMDDLLKKEERDRLLLFAKGFFTISRIVSPPHGDFGPSCMIHLPMPLARL